MITTVAQSTFGAGDLRARILNISFIVAIGSDSWISISDQPTSTFSLSLSILAKRRSGLMIGDQTIYSDWNGHFNCIVV